MSYTWMEPLSSTGGDSASIRESVEAKYKKFDRSRFANATYDDSPYSEEDLANWLES